MTTHLLVTFTNEVSNPPYIRINTANTLFSTSSKLLVLGLAQNRLLLVGKTSKGQTAQNRVKGCVHYPFAWMKANPLDKRFQLLGVVLINVMKSFRAKNPKK